MSLPDISEMDGFLLRLCYRIPATVIYILVFRAIWKDKSRYSGSFYRLFMVSSVVNIFVFFNATITLQVIKLIPHGSVLAQIYFAVPELIQRFMYTMTYHFAFVQFYIILFMALNRLTVLLTPFQHEKIWSKWLWPLTAFAYFSPFAFTWRIMAKPADFREKADSTVGLEFRLETKREDITFVFQWLLIFMISLVLLTLMTNLWTAYLFAVHRGQKLKRNEFGMHILSVYNFVMQVLVALFTYFAMSDSLASDNYKAFRVLVAETLPYVSDLLTFSNAFVFLILMKGVRASVFSCLSFCQQSTVVRSTASNTVLAPRSL